MRKLAMALIACSTTIGSAHAATIFTSRAAFDAATTGSTSRAFPAASAGTADPIYTFNSVTFDTALAGDRYMSHDGLFNAATYLATGLGGVVTISSTLNAIGLYLGSAEGARSFGYKANGTTGTFTTLASDRNDGKFIGFLDTNPISVTFDARSGAEFDIVSYVTTDAAAPTPAPNPAPPVAGAVPEPATWAMMILGFGLVGGATRRRRPVVGAARHRAA